ncbi:hypothetical protein SADUNF_Sadunf14G0098000 [Salix dunnii]|uniref:Rhodanese domain-containing protein n=1 Tax=Salix dunnii TaxID=1413687 RepID=A0A835JEX6_9ROSI|nr:hypothetical protein SADUNF_Sadunf14G0098000 [Salix dunnii]
MELHNSHPRRPRPGKKGDNDSLWIVYGDERPQDVISVGVHTAKDLIASSHRYLDVRTTEEFSKSHIDNALNVPFMFITAEGKVRNPEFLSKVASICNKDDYLVVVNPGS